MKKLKDYKILTTLYQNKAQTVYRALLLKDNTSVILKVLNPSFRNEGTITQFKQEYHVLKKLNSKYISHLLDATFSASEYFLVFKDTKSISCDDFIQKHPFTIDTILNIMQQSIKALLYIHNNGIIHTNINPRNLLYNEQTKEITLINFTNTLYINKQIPNTEKFHNENRDLAYVAPEQTQKVTWKLDYRSDFYSLGLTLYTLLTNQPPFKTKDSAELIYAQLNQQPLDLKQYRSDVPEVLENILKKLMEKNPDFRYQRHKAILHDIAIAVKYLKEYKLPNNFTLAQYDYFNINHNSTFFAREEELLKANKLFEIQNTIRCKTIFIHGESGVGKSRLVEEIFTRLVTQTSPPITVSGKFDLSYQSQPYAIFKQIFFQLDKLIASQDSKFIKSQKEHLDIIQNFFPELTKSNSKTLHDNHETISTQDKLPFAVKSLLKSLSNYKITIAIDDLQWADKASILLLTNLVFSSKLTHISYIIIYRQSELHKNNDAYSFVKNKNRIVDTNLDLHLENLSKIEISHILKKLFAVDTHIAINVANLLHDKTHGNIFYLKNFLQYLIDEKIITPTQNRWQFHVESIQTMQSTPNVVDIINKKFFHLHKDAQKYLKHLALLGNKFNLTLSKDLLTHLHYNKEIIYILQIQDFIKLDEENYKFLHDQIQKFVIEQIVESEKQEIYLILGNFLQKKYTQGHYGDIIQIVICYNAVYTHKLPRNLLSLYSQAIKLMLSNLAYSLALQSLKLLEKSCQMSSYAQIKLKTEVFYLNAQHDNAFAEISNLKQKANSLTKKLECYSLYKNICITKSKHFNSLIQCAHEIFLDLGISSFESKQIDITLENINNKILSHAFFKQPKTILKHKKMTNIKQIKLLGFLVDYWESCFYLVDLKQMRWAYLSIIEHSFNYGNSSYSSFAYILYGMELVQKKLFKKAGEFANVSLAINKKFHDDSMLPKVHNFVANFVNPYYKPLVSNIELYAKSLHQAKINQDIVFGTWANFLMHLSDYLSGTNLDDVIEHIDKQSEFILRSSDTKMIQIFKLLRNEIEYLISGEIKPTNQELINALEAENFAATLSWYGIIKAQTALLMSQPQNALDILQKYVKEEANEVIMFPKIRLHLIRIISLSILTRELREDEENLLLSDLEIFESYIHANPKNFRFEALLLQALQTKKQINLWESAQLFDKAIEEAQKQNNNFFIILSNLVATLFWKENNYRDLTSLYLNQTLNTLQLWGSNFLYTTTKQLTPDQNNIQISNKSKQKPSQNYLSLIESFQAISSATDTNSLLQTLMQTILHNANVTSAVVLVRENKDFVQKVSLNFKTAEINLHTSFNIPKRMIANVIKNKKVLIAQKPKNSVEFEFDSYIQQNNPQTCYMIPALVEKKVESMLYLENNDISLELNENDILTLEQLLIQATIVLKNISLYNDVNHHLSKLNEAQAIANIGSWQFNNSSQEITWSAQTYRIYNLEPFSIPIDNEWFVEHLVEEEKEYVMQAADKLMRGEEEYDVTHKIITVDNKEKIVRQRAKAWSENGVTFMSGTIQDITEQSLKDKLFLMQTRQAQMGEMLSMIAHQWRQPLAVMNNIVSLQRLNFIFQAEDIPATLTAEMTRSFDDLETHIQHLSQTIDDFRDFFKPDKSPNITKNSTIIEKALRIVESLLNTNGVEVLTEYENDNEYSSFENELEQVILNLLTNANDAFIQKNTQNPQISIKTNIINHVAHIDILDNAGGVEPAMLNDLFLPYTSTKNAKNGTGLGLYMSKTIVEEHCLGSLDVENRENGALFSIKFPV